MLSKVKILFFFNLHDPNFWISVACFLLTFHTPITPALGLCENTSFNRKLCDSLLASIILKTLISVVFLGNFQVFSNYSVDIAEYWSTLTFNIECKPYIQV